MTAVIIRTVVPIFLLIGLGFFARYRGLLKAGDERVFSAYVYYFALPALFLINLSETQFTPQALRFVLTAIIPILIIMVIYIILFLVFRFDIEKFYLLILSTVFGSTAFFGIPFIIFAFPYAVAEHLAVLAAAVISGVAVTISILTLEVYRLGRKGGFGIGVGLKEVLKRFSRNPLIISILIGVLLSLMRVSVPAPLSSLLHMLGRTTATIAIFMLGVFLYGRKYSELGRAFRLSSLRILILPAIAWLATRIFALSPMESSILVLMHSMPLAISMIVLSERYDFQKETIASLILISSMGAAIYLNIWLFILGVK
jgi:malonate transporter